jgi:mRNA-degrading endonuclease HigB of HigAB toxin-antitoxin module
MISVILTNYILPYIQENFNQCITPLKNIFSLDVELILDKNKYVFEYSISKFRRMLKTNNIKKKNFLKEINKIKEIDKVKFEVIYTLDDELIIYRPGKYFGFHIRFLKGNVEVVGIIYEYDLVTRYMTRKIKTLEEIQLLHASDPSTSAYV